MEKPVDGSNLTTEHRNVLQSLLKTRRNKTEKWERRKRKVTECGSSCDRDSLS
jgi:hypothetical protein